VHILTAVQKKQIVLDVFYLLSAVENGRLFAGADIWMTTTNQLSL